MKWKAKTIPKIGDTRKVRKFAFLPKKCSEYTVWLETYESFQRLEPKYIGQKEKWVEIERRELWYTM